MDDIYKNMDEYNSNKERKRLILFDSMIADILSNKNSNPIVTELFIRGRKLKKLKTVLYRILLYQKNILHTKKLHNLFSTHKKFYTHFIAKIPNKWFEKVVFNHYQILTLETWWVLTIFFFSDWYYSCIR